MDRNTIIGLVVIFLILIGFSYINRPSQEHVEAARRRSDSLAFVKTEQDREFIESQSKILEVENSQQLAGQDLSLSQSSFAQSITGEQRFYTLENDLIRLKISTLGGSIYSAEIKNYKTYSQEPLILFADHRNAFGLQFWGENKNVETQKLFFTPSTSDTLIIAEESTGDQSLAMRLYAGDSSYIDYVYTIHPGSHLVDFAVRFSEMDRILASNTNSIDLIWNIYGAQLEKNNAKESEYSTIAYQLSNGDFEELNSRNDEVSEDVTTRIKWIGYKQQFFSTFLVSNDFFVNANMSTTKLLDGENIKRFSSRIAIPIENGKAEEQTMQFYFGPTHFNTLKNYNYGFEDVIPLGGWVIKWVNRYVIIFLFDLLDNRIANYGLIILIMTLIIKLVLFPLTYKSYLSQAKMRVLKPQIDDINAKYPKKEDAMKKQQSTMALYKKVGVSPMGGCLPMLIQFPFLIAMFRFFPASFELRQKGFLWAEDLSTYDSIFQLPFDIPFYGDHVSLFTLLMAVALFFTSRLTSGQMADNPQMPGMKFMMLYMMPLMLLFFFNSYSAGLSYYYFLSNVITLGQTLLIRKTVDDEELLRKLNDNAKKPAPKKSKFQAKLEQMTKLQQQEQKYRKK